MKNKEKFAKEIVEIAINSYGLSVNKNLEVIPCDSYNCDNCFFLNGDGCCADKRKQWAEAEYVEPKLFTEEEKAILRALPKVNWVARDENETIYFFAEKPVKKTYYFFAEKPVKKTYIWDTVGDSICLVNWSDAKFSAIKREDSEPTSREEILK